MPFQKLTAQEKDQRYKAVLLLRFRTTTPDKKSYKYCAFSTISKSLGIPYNVVRYSCCKALKRVKRVTIKHTERKLEQEHIDFLVSKDTLQLWAGKIMKERCKLFHRKFPNKRIAVTTLRRLYLKNKVRRKKVRQEKYLPDKFKLKYDDERRRLIDDLAKAKSQNREVQANINS